MLVNYSYLQDLDFLSKIDNLQVQEQYVKITLLNWEEKPIQEIQGLVTGGNLNLDGKSGMRRNGSISLYVPNEEFSQVTNPSNLFSINKKIFLEIGIKNTTAQYTEYPIIWFPQGTFVIINPSLSHSTSGVNLNLQF
jgi:hypothetical protein